MVGFALLFYIYMLWILVLVDSINSTWLFWNCFAKLFFLLCTMLLLMYLFPSNAVNEIVVLFLLVLSILRGLQIFETIKEI